MSRYRHALPQLVDRLFLTDAGIGTTRRMIMATIPHAHITTAALAIALGGMTGAQTEQTWTDQFGVEPGELASTGRNPYFVLEPGYRLTLEDGDERLAVTVLADTKVVDGVETRVVEERESEGGELVEVSRNYFAISKRTNSVFYFGEDVDIYKNGKVVNHEGSWLAGVNGARFGLIMPGLPLLGGRYYQEIAPGIAMDRAQIVSANGTLKVPAGSFTTVLRIEETTPLERGAREYKLYAPGVGLLQEESLRLVQHGTVR
jgi:hypothetical protein